MRTKFSLECDSERILEIGLRVLSYDQKLSCCMFWDALYIIRVPDYKIPGGLQDLCIHSGIQRFTKNRLKLFIFSIVVCCINWIWTY